MKKSTAAAALLILCILPAALCSCSSGGAEQTSAPEVTSAEPAFLPLTENGEFIYKLVREDNMNKTVVQSFSDLGKKFNEQHKAAGFDSRVGIITDWDKNVKKGEIVRNDDMEILVGNTNRAESQKAMEGLKGEYDYVICRDGNKIVIAGGGNDALLRAIEIFTAAADAETGVDMSVFETRFCLGEEGSVLRTLIDEYTVIRSAGAGEHEKEAAAAMREGLSAMAGYTADDTPLGILTDGMGDAEVPGEHEILVGNTGRELSAEAAEKLSCLDYTVMIKDGCLAVCGGSPFACRRGVEKVLELIRTGAISSLDGDFEYTEDFETVYPQNPLIYDASGFVPAWSDRFTPPEWMHDLREKVRALVAPVGMRNTSVAHRGDSVYYPENSVEGYLSAALAGADSVEVDVRLTADFVPVMMHDATLTRMTDVDAKKGTNGLPSSVNIEDWTYAQLLELSLKMPDGRVTEYKIPTFYEATAILAGRCFIQIDDKLSMMDPDADVFPVALETGALASYYYFYGGGRMSIWSKKPGVDDEFLDFVSYIYKTSASKSFRSRYWVPTGSPENAATWDAMRRDGQVHVWANVIVDYCRYIADKYKAVK